MEAADYTPPHSVPWTPKFSNWAHPIIYALDLHPDPQSDPGSSYAEQVLLAMWGADNPDVEIERVIFRQPAERWGGVCNHCGGNCEFTRERPFHCPSCAKILFIDTQTELKEYGRAMVAEKARLHKIAKLAAKERRRVRKLGEKMKAAPKPRAVEYSKHPLLAEDPYYFEDDPYYLNKAREQHKMALEIEDED